MGCLNCRIQLLSKQINCSIEAKDLLNVYLQLLNKNVVIDNELKNTAINVLNNSEDSLSISTKVLRLDINNRSLDKIWVDNKYIDISNKTILISNKLIENFKIVLKEYATSISNKILKSTINVDNIIVSNIITVNTLLDKVSINHSMLCNIAEHILLISEDDELIIDESGNFYIEV